MFIHINKRKAQSITEYAVLMGIIVLAIVLTQVYLKRSVQGKFKSSADDIGEQFTTGEKYSHQKIFQSARKELSGTDTFVDYDASGKEVASSITAGKVWSQSMILDKTKFADDLSKLVQLERVKPKLDEYAGQEVSNSDYIKRETDTIGKGTVGVHGTFDSGVLQSKNPFDEATNTQE